MRIATRWWVVLVCCAVPVACGDSATSRDSAPANEVTALARALGRVTGAVSTTRGGTAIDWERTTTGDADAERIVASLGAVITSRGLVPRQCATNAATGQTDNWFWESAHLAVYIRRVAVPAAPPKLTITTVDTPTSVPVSACPVKLAEVLLPKPPLAVVAPPRPRRITARTHRRSVRAPASPTVTTPPAADPSPSEKPQTPPPVPTRDTVRADSTRTDTVSKALPVVEARPAATRDSVAVATQLPVLRPFSWGPVASEVNTHAGILGHQFGGSRVLVPIVGLRLVPVRFGSLGIGGSFDWWTDGVNLGPLFSSRSVGLTYLTPMFELSLNLGSLWGSDVVWGGGLGVEFIRFSNRFDASTLFPASSVSPSATLSVGDRIRLTDDGRVMLRVDARARGAYAEIFDPAGVRHGRELTFSPELSVGLSYVLRRTPP